MNIGAFWFNKLHRPSQDDVNSWEPLANWMNRWREAKELDNLRRIEDNRNYLGPEISSYANAKDTYAPNSSKVRLMFIYQPF